MRNNCATTQCRSGMRSISRSYLANSLIRWFSTCLPIHCRTLDLSSRLLRPGCPLCATFPASAALAMVPRWTPASKAALATDSHSWDSLPPAHSRGDAAICRRSSRSLSCAPGEISPLFPPPRRSVEAVCSSFIKPRPILTAHSRNGRASGSFSRSLMRSCESGQGCGFGFGIQHAFGNAHLLPVSPLGILTFHATIFM